MLICYVCGQGFGSASLKPHTVKCRQLFLDRQATKANPADRRSVPEPPTEVLFPLPDLKDTAKVTAFNDKMFAVYNTHSLEPCGRCGRTFHADALVRHQRVCGGNGQGGGGEGERAD